MLTLISFLASIAAHAADKPVTVDPSGSRIKMSNRVEIQCPSAGKFSIGFSSDTKRGAFATALIGAGKALPNLQLAKLNSWLSQLGIFEYARVGCAGEGAIFRVVLADKIDGKPVARSLTFVINNGDLERDPN